MKILIAAYERLIKLKNIALIKTKKYICIKIKKPIGFKVEKITKNKLFKN